MKLTADQIAQLEEETVLFCQEMIQIPSVNYGEGKGDERLIAEYVAGKLSEVGIVAELKINNFLRVLYDVKFH